MGFLRTIAILLLFSAVLLAYGNAKNSSEKVASAQYHSCLRGNVLRDVVATLSEAVLQIERTGARYSSLQDTREQFRLLLAHTTAVLEDPNNKLLLKPVACEYVTPLP